MSTPFNAEAEVGSIKQEQEMLRSDMREIKGSLTSLIGQMGAMQASLNVQTATRGTMDVKTIMTIGAALLAIGGVIFTALDTKFQASIAGYSQRTTVLERQMDAVGNLSGKVSISELNDAQSFKDREALNRFDTRQLDVNGRFETALTRLENQFIESETQQRANSQIRNMLASAMEARLAELYEDVKDRPMPRQTYWPDISLPKPSK